MGRVKGGKISTKLAFVREVYGEAMVQKVLGSMAPEDQLSLKIVLDSAWYPIELYDRLVVAICMVAAGGDESVYERIGQHSANRAFTTTYKAFRGKNPTDMIEKMASMHALRNDPAEMKVLAQQGNSCVVRILKPRSTPALCKVAYAFFIQTIELCGARSVRVKETECSGKGGAYCQFEISWR